MYNFRMPSKHSIKQLIKVARALTAALAVATIVGLGACSKQSSTQDAEAASLPNLRRLEGRGARVYVLARAEKWTEATRQFTDMKQYVQSLDADSTHSIDTTQLDAQIKTLEQALTAKNKIAAMQAANQMAIDSAILSKPLHPPEPVEATLLSGYSRQLELDAIAQNATALKTTAGNIQTTWSALRSQVAAEGGTDQVQQLDGLVAQLGKAQSPQQYRQLASAILRKAREVEGVFRQ